MTMHTGSTARGSDICKAHMYNQSQNFHLLPVWNILLFPTLSVTLLITAGTPILATSMSWPTLKALNREAWHLQRASIRLDLSTECFNLCRRFQALLKVCQLFAR